MRITVAGRAFEIDDGQPARTAAEFVVMDLTRHQVRDTAIEYVARLVEEERRKAARLVEQRALRAERRSSREYVGSMRRRWEEEHPGLEYNLGTVFDEWVREIRAEVRLEVTAELLATSFALGDGRVTTWGEATVLDHTTRVELLRQNVIGNLETLVLHQAAIALIEESGVERLADLPVAEAVA